MRVTTCLKHASGFFRSTGFFRLCPPSGILETRERSVSETGTVPTHLRTETDQFLKYLCSLDFRISDDGWVKKLSNSECYAPSSEPLEYTSGFLLSLFCDPEDGGSLFLWSVGGLRLNYTALQPTRLSSLYSLLWEPQICYPVVSILLN